jgi:hypothetical protein
MIKGNMKIAQDKETSIIYNAAELLEGPQSNNFVEKQKERFSLNVRNLILMKIQGLDIILEKDLV